MHARSHARSDWAQAKPGSVGFGWRHQDRLNQPYQREPVGGGTLLLAGGFRRIFVWPLSIEGREQLHPGPGKTPCAQNLSPGISPVSQEVRDRARRALHIQTAGGEIIGLIGSRAPRSRRRLKLRQERHVYSKRSLRV